MSFFILVRAMPRSTWWWCLGLVAVQGAILGSRLYLGADPNYLDLAFWSLFGVSLFFTIGLLRLETAIERTRGVIEGVNMVLKLYGETGIDPDKVLISIDNCNVHMDLSEVRKLLEKAEANAAADSVNG